jgi:hypothetical protein
MAVAFCVFVKDKVWEEMFLKVALCISIVWGVLVVRRLKPEERVNLAIGMSDVCIRVCADGVRDQNPGISEEELIERVRERLMFGKRRRCGV